MASTASTRQQQAFARFGIVDLTDERHLAQLFYPVDELPLLTQSRRACGEYARNQGTTRDIINTHSKRNPTYEKQAHWHKETPHLEGNKSHQYSEGQRDRPQCHGDQPLARAQVCRLCELTPHLNDQDLCKGKDEGGGEAGKG